MEIKTIVGYEYLTKEQKDIYKTRCPDCGHSEFHIIVGESVVLWCDNCLTSIDENGGVI